MRIIDWSSDVCSSDLLCRRSILSDRFLAGKENEHGEPKGDRRKRGPKSGTGDAPWGREDQHVHLTRNRADCRVVVHHFGADCGPAPEGGIPAIPWCGSVQPGLLASCVRNPEVGTAQRGEKGCHSLKKIVV